MGTTNNGMQNYHNPPNCLDHTPSQPREQLVDNSNCVQRPYSYSGQHTSYTTAPQWGQYQSNGFHASGPGNHQINEQYQHYHTQQQGNHNQNQHGNEQQMPAERMAETYSRQPTQFIQQYNNSNQGASLQQFEQYWQRQLQMNQVVQEQYSSVIQQYIQVNQAFAQLQTNLGQVKFFKEYRAHQRKLLKQKSLKLRSMQKANKKLIRTLGSLSEVKEDLEYQNNQKDAEIGELNAQVHENSESFKELERELKDYKLKLQERDATIQEKCNMVQKLKGDVTSKAKDLARLKEQNTELRLKLIQTNKSLTSIHLSFTDCLSYFRASDDSASLYCKFAKDSSVRQFKSRLKDWFSSIYSTRSACKQDLTSNSALSVKWFDVYLKSLHTPITNKSNTVQTVVGSKIYRQLVDMESSYTCRSIEDFVAALEGAKCVNLYFAGHMMKGDEPVKLAQVLLRAMGQSSEELPPFTASVQVREGEEVVLDKHGDEFCWPSSKVDRFQETDVMVLMFKSTGDRASLGQLEDWLKQHSKKSGTYFLAELRSASSANQPRQTISVLPTLQLPPDFSQFTINNNIQEYPAIPLVYGQLKMSRTQQSKLWQFDDQIQGQKGVVPLIQLIQCVGEKGFAWRLARQIKNNEALLGELMKGGG